MPTHAHTASNAEYAHVETEPQNLVKTVCTKFRLRKIEALDGIQTDEILVITPDTYCD